MFVVMLHKHKNYNTENANFINAMLMLLFMLNI